jgi:ABC-type multidrug transport system permease subunit
VIRGIWRLAALDLAIWIRSPWAIAAAVIPPLAMALLLWVLAVYAHGEPIALVVESHGRYADRMTSIIRDESSGAAVTVTDRPTAERMLHDQQVAAIIILPPGFNEAVSKRRPLLPFIEATQDTRFAPETAPRANLQVILNNVGGDISDDIRRLVDRAVARYDAADIVTPVYEGELDMAELNPYRVNVMLSQMRQTTVDELHYLVVPGVILLVLTVGVMGTALLCAQDVERGTGRHLALSPLPPAALVAGRLLGGLLATLVIVVPVLVLAAVAGLLQPPAGHWPALVALFLATALSGAGLGAALGSVLRGPRVVSMAASVLATYLFFMGGGFTTTQYLPGWLRQLTAVVPTRYAIDGLRQSLFYPGLEGVTFDLEVLFATALLAIAAGAFFVRRSWSA